MSEAPHPLVATAAALPRTRKQLALSTLALLLIYVVLRDQRRARRKWMEQGELLGVGECAQVGELGFLRRGWFATHASPVCRLAPFLL